MVVSDRIFPGNV